LLGDLFGGAPASPPKSNAVPDILSGFASAPTTTNYTVYSKNSLLITLAAQPKPGNLSVNITATFANTGSTPITNMLFQVAVPKTLKLTMMPPSNSTIQAGGKETQAIAIENPTKVTFVSSDGLFRRPLNLESN
jgi:AP-1 complex subunit gamma-1